MRKMQEENEEGEEEIKERYKNTEWSKIKVDSSSASFCVWSVFSSEMRGCSLPQASYFLCESRNHYSQLQILVSTSNHDTRPRTLSSSSE